MSSHPRFLVKACLNTDSHLLRAQVKYIQTHWSCLYKQVNYAPDHPFAPSSTGREQPVSMQTNSLPPTQGIFIKGVCRQWSLSLLTRDLAFFWDMFIQLRLKLHLVTVPATEEYRSLIFFLLSTKPPQKRCFPENKLVLCQNWKSNASRSMVPSHGNPVPTVFPVAEPDGFSCAHIAIFSPKQERYSQKSRGKNG